MGSLERAGKQRCAGSRKPLKGRTGLTGEARTAAKRQHARPHELPEGRAGSRERRGGALAEAA